MDRPGPGRGRELGVLALAFAAALALIGAAVFAVDDARSAGEAAFARDAGAVAGGIADEWERLRRDRNALERLGPYAREVDWDPDVPDLPALDVRELLELRDPGHAAFDALLAEAVRLDVLENNAHEALAAVREALAKGADYARLALARLLAIQLAASAERADVVREQWSVLVDSIDGADARDGTSVLLLALLAADAHLSPAERALAREHVVALWGAEQLALPGEALESPDDPDAFFAAESPLRATLAQRTQALDELRGPDGRIERTERRHRTRALAQVLGTLPAPPSDGSLGIDGSTDFVFVHRRVADGRALGRFLEPGRLGAELVYEVREHGLVPPGFTADFAGDDESAGAVVRGRTDLAPGLGFVLRHADSESAIAAAGGRRRFLRVGLVGMALVVAFAGVSTFRALRRERKLADLKTAFVANVSHELRTPLSSILLMAENLEAGRAGEASRERYPALIRREAQRLRRLVDDVLDFARLERGEKPRMRVEDVRVAELAEALESEARERVESAGGTLAFASNGVPERMRLDGEAVRRAVLNLVDNACKHSGSERIEIELGGDGANGLAVRVRDHGCGVAPELRARILRPFERVERADAAPGAGLGLAIVGEIAAVHGGSLTVDAPAEGAGAVFELRLPHGEAGA